MGYFNNFKFNLESKPICCMLYCYYFMKNSTALIQRPSEVDDIIMLIYACVYIKINGVTSTCTQNKSDTTHLYLPSLTSVCKNIQTIKHNKFLLYILHIYMDMYITLIILFMSFKLSEVSHIGHVLTLINANTI